jgi:hypothetical protein
LGYSGLGSSPKNSMQRDMPSCTPVILLSKMLLVIFPNCCNTFNFEHLQVCFSCTCII